MLTTVHPTLLSRLVREGRWTIEETCAAYEQTARQMGEDATLSVRQLCRWMDGTVQRPQPVSRRVAEQFWGLPFPVLVGPAEVTPNPLASADAAQLPSSETPHQRGAPEAGDPTNRLLGWMSLVNALRVMDSQIGAAPIYPTVLAYLRTHIAPQLVDGTGDSQPSFAAAASALEMAGWMAHDCGDDAAARSHFQRALTLSALGGDLALRAHILGSLSHLASHDGEAGNAILFARQAHEALRRAPRHPPSTARILALEARGHIHANDHTASRKLLAHAEAELTNTDSYHAPSPWVTRYDRASLASDSARCFHAMGDLEQARHHAELIVTLRPAHNARSRGLGLLMLAQALVGQRRLGPVLPIK